MYYRNPFQAMDLMRNEIDKVVDSYCRTGECNGWRSAFLPATGARRYPKINLYDDQDHFYVEALAPGIDASKLEVSLIGNTLTLSGEKLASTGEVKPEAVHRSERATGRFVRTVELPSMVDSKQVSAEYKNGILLITLPKAEEAKARTIAVKVA